MAGVSLPPGFRFHPTDVELVMYYLKKKATGKRLLVDAISELNIYNYSPWDLPGKSCLRSKDLEWYFFCPIERKYASGARINRKTEFGFWKSTGKDRPVVYKEQTVGMVKTLVFHKGHAPNGDRTDWVIHEYRLSDAGVVQGSYVLCKVFHKNGLGPRIGSHYGGPFNEEDWDDDLDMCAESGRANCQSLPTLPCHNNDSAVTNMCIPGSISGWPSSEPGPSNVLPLAKEPLPPVLEEDEDILSLLDIFTEDGTSAGCNGNNEAVNNEPLPPLDGSEIYNSLEDLDNWAELKDDQLNLSGCQTTEYSVNLMHVGEYVPFLELNDLNCPLNYPTETFGSEHFLPEILSETCKNNYLQQNHSPINSYGTTQHVSTENQLTLLSEGSNVIGDHFHMFQENDVEESTNSELAAAGNLDIEQLEVRSRYAVQDRNRGEHQRNSYSRLQQLLESIPAVLRQQWSTLLLPMGLREPRNLIP
ncbi:hypothetical protein NMG60_11007057 [Bertholletia excelsa]